MWNRPGTDEYSTYFAKYIDTVPDGNLLEFLENQTEPCAALLASLPEEKGNYAYAPGKWTVKEVVAHITDTERVMSYRLLRISRGDETPLPGFDQDLYARQTNFNDIPLAKLQSELEAVRQATLHQMSLLTEEALRRRGTVSGNPISARALAFIIAGHMEHHFRVLRDLYLGDAAHEQQ